MSVDNKAMTIKDLSEMTMTMGYNCLNVSAASQAITTYIRAHLQRCDAQQDQPLMLKHVLSGTAADDDLLPALHSTSGGAPTSSESRQTNFRRGTVVWYMSRVTGLPCPFARAGIRLCDYVDAPPKKREQCGEKRKRRSTRECVLKHVPGPSRETVRSSSPFSSDSDEDDENDDAPPPVKIKLTLRLPPLARVRQTPRRSPSVPHSVASAASPPPDSDDDDDDNESDSDDSSDEESEIEVDTDESIDEDVDLVADEAQLSDQWDEDDDEEVSTTWESPGPRSPSAQSPPVRVKEEPQDVQGLLDQWEYDLDIPLVKSEPWDWDWNPSYRGPSSSPSDSSISMSSPIQRIKEEEDLTLSFSGPHFTDWRESDALSPTSPFGFTFTDDSSLSPGVFPVPSTSRLPTPESPSITHSLSTLVHSLSMDSPVVPPPLFNVSGHLFSELEEELEPPPPCVSPHEIRIEGSTRPEAIVVKTCEPCNPEIIATHIEDIAVYQSSLGPHTLLRRIDTDFVNLSPIMKYARTPQPVMTAIPGAAIVTKGRPEVRGLWVPLEAVRLYVKDCITSKVSVDPIDVLDVFLSDTLAERFPPALREFVRNTSLTKGPLVRQFGKNFSGDDLPSSLLNDPPNPTLMAAVAAKDRMAVDDQNLPSPLHDVPLLIPPLDVPLSSTEEKIFDEFCVNLEWEKDANVDGMDLEDALRTVMPLIRTPTKIRSRARPTSTSPLSSPLSSCPPSPVLDQAPLPSEPASETDAVTSTSTRSGSLRRSKRVADALAARSNIKTRSSNRGSRNLS
ncbi:hypothetical protein BDP27DRAFT_1425003 [Rhodocollybia butyracea]|uniref:HTH APSES-type domain-containing protein n=1 Tax=Rhodocollybia butyracea TaxID=206335 RepID=A0A9P5PK19_9AGAR|nr:hypothetical protein BDP27DRAFT_1425003 [Rhodocollybia butyracea]